jgi:hypothetical protein
MANIGVSVSITPGTWLLMGNLQWSNAAGGGNINGQIFDSTNSVVASNFGISVGTFYSGAGTLNQAIPLMGVYTVSASATLNMQARFTVGTAGTLAATGTGMWAIRIF